MARDHGANSSGLLIYSVLYHAHDGTGAEYNVTECLRKMSSQGSLVLDVENHNFVVDGCNYVPHDPKPYTAKTLEVEYSYGNRNRVSIERPEHTRLVLPEDTWHVGQIRRLNEELRKQEPQAAIVLGNCPRLIIHFTSTLLEERIIFTNDGDRTATNISIGSLEWEERHVSPITLYHTPTALTPGNSEEARLIFEREPQFICPMREYLQRNNVVGGKKCVAVTFEDMNGVQFEQVFTVTIFPDETVVWQPGPVSLRDREKTGAA
jgi:hypothetical protein